MEANFKATDADEMSFTLTVTMKLKEWKALKEQVRQDYPGWKLRGAIVNMVDAAQKHFTASELE